MEINFGLVACHKGQREVIHFCGYPNKPTQEDVDGLLEELATDEEFGLVGVELDIYEATDEIINHFVSTFESDEANTENI